MTMHVHEKSRVEQAPSAQCTLACAIHAVWQKNLQCCARRMQEYGSVLCAKIALPASYVAKGSQQEGCAIELHTPSCVL
jgi:hypothetical protein